MKFLSGLSWLQVKPHFSLLNFRLFNQMVRIGHRIYPEILGVQDMQEKP